MIVKSSWTASDDDFVRQNWGKISASAIGSKLGRTKNSIVGRAHRLELPKLAARTEKSYRSRGAGVPHPPPPPPRPPVPPPPQRWRGLANVGVSDCRWPQYCDDLRRPAVAFCCAPVVVPTSSYCLEHHMRAYTRTLARA